MALTSITPHAGRVYVNALLTTNIASLSGAQTIDGVALTAGMLCGALGQTSATTRAVYVVQSGAWLVADPGIGTNLEVQALEGTLNKNAVYGCDTTGAITWGTTSVTFTKKSSTGAAFDPHSPGPMGDSTPDTFSGTTITATTGFTGKLGLVTPNDAAVKDLRLAVGDGLATASRLVLSPSADFSQLGMKEPAGGQVFYGMLLGSATMVVNKQVLCISLADDATRDITLLAGGHGTVTAPATGGASGSFSFLANGTTDLNGLTYSTFAVADTDTKLCAFASGGKLRIKNRLGSTQVVLIELTQGVSA